MNPFRTSYYWVEVTKTCGPDVNGNPITTDQRGVTRPQGRGCDIGAFERFQSQNLLQAVATPHEVDFHRLCATHIIVLFRSMVKPVVVAA